MKIYFLLEHGLFLNYIMSMLYQITKGEFLINLERMKTQNADKKQKATPTQPKWTDHEVRKDRAGMNILSIWSSNMPQSGPFDWRRCRAMAREKMANTAEKFMWEILVVWKQFLVWLYLPEDRVRLRRKRAELGVQWDRSKIQPIRPREWWGTPKNKKCKGFAYLKTMWNCKTLI